MPGLPRPPLKTARIYHLPTAAATSQGYPSTPDLTIPVGFLPLDRKDHVMEPDASVAYEMYVTPPSADVRRTDKVVIDGQNLYVSFVFKADVGRLAHLRCSLSTQAVV
jgi:hypothetical protein